MKLSERLEAIARGQVWGASDFYTLDAAIALARSVEDAPVVEMPSRPGPALQGANLVIGVEAAERMGLDGQRVRIVPEQGEGDRG